MLPRQCLRAGEKGGEGTGPNPTDRGKPGSKRHVLVDANGIPLALELTPANVHDSTMLEPVLGFWMVPLGLVLLALDVVLLRRPTARMLVGGERLWGRLRRAWRTR